MKLISIKPSPRDGKRFVATFEKEGKTIMTHFGQQGGSTYIDHKDDVKKANYIKRHTVNEDWSDATKAGTLARYILWNKKTVSESIADYKRKFGI